MVRDAFQKGVNIDNLVEILRQQFSHIAQWVNDNPVQAKRAAEEAARFQR